MAIRCRETLHTVVASGQQYGAKGVDDDVDSDIKLLHRGAASSGQRANAVDVRAGTGESPGEEREVKSKCNECGECETKYGFPPSGMTSLQKS
jgi:hypothetical protein